MFSCLNIMSNNCSILALIQWQWLLRATNICIPTHDEIYTHILLLLLIQCFAAYMCASQDQYIMVNNLSSEMDNRMLRPQLHLDIINTNCNRFRLTFLS